MDPSRGNGRDRRGFAVFDPTDGGGNSDSNHVGGEGVSGSLNDFWIAQQLNANSRMPGTSRNSNEELELLLWQHRQQQQQQQQQLLVSNDGGASGSSSAMTLPHNNVNTLPTSLSLYAALLRSEASVARNPSIFGGLPLVDGTSAAAHPGHSAEALNSFLRSGSAGSQLSSGDGALSSAAASYYNDISGDEAKSNRWALGRRESFSTLEASRGVTSYSSSLLGEQESLEQFLLLQQEQILQQQQLMSLSTQQQQQQQAQFLSCSNFRSGGGATDSSASSLLQALSGSPSTAVATLSMFSPPTAPTSMNQLRNQLVSNHQQAQDYLELYNQLSNNRFQSTPDQQLAALLQQQQQQQQQQQRQELFSSSLGPEASLGAASMGLRGSLSDSVAARLSGPRKSPLGTDASSHCASGGGDVQARAPTGPEVKQEVPEAATNVSNKAKRPKKQKDKNKPKRPLSAYNLFFQEERTKLLSEIASDSKEESKSAADQDAAAGPPKKRRKRKRGEPHGMITFEKLAKIIGARWKSIEGDRLAAYKARAERDLQRYKDEMKVYMQERRQHGRLKEGDADGGEEDEAKEGEDDDEEDSEEEGVND